MLWGSRRFEPNWSKRFSEGLISGHCSLLFIDVQLIRRFCQRVLSGLGWLPRSWGLEILEGMWSFSKDPLYFHPRRSSNYQACGWGYKKWCRRSCGFLKNKKAHNITTISRIISAVCRWFTGRVMSLKKCCVIEFVFIRTYKTHFSLQNRKLHLNWKR